MIKRFISLTKPGIIVGNILTAFAGFALASHGNVISWAMLAMLLGLSLVIGGSCVLNNYIDRDIDAKMQRTESRELVVKSVSVRSALTFGAVLIVGGISVLVLLINLLAAAIALIGVVIYVVVYSMWAKRTTEYATEIGSIAGAVPPVVGYCAASNSLDTGAVLLFFILCFWQMPHFFAIALRRKDDYAAASIPVLPLRRGVRTTVVRMVIYITLFFFATTLLFAYGYVGYAYLLVMTICSLAWLIITLRGFSTSNMAGWARKTFLFSLVVLLLFVLFTVLAAV